MTALASVIERAIAKAGTAEKRYSGFASAHEALGVLVEEMAELVEAVRANDLEMIEAEAEDVAAVALRLAASCHAIDFQARSVK